MTKSIADTSDSVKHRRAAIAAPWQPTRVILFERACGTSMDTAEVLTDSGHGYLKALGNKEGPHPLACEFVGTNLAAWLGLTVFDHSLIAIDKATEIPLSGGRQAKPGNCFVTRKVVGHSWGGSADELELIENPDDLTRLVIFDTWTLNCDRYSLKPGDTKPRINYGNVFLSEEGATAGKFRVVAMDSTHCFTCGNEIDRSISHIGRVQADAVFGLFPAFGRYIKRDVVEMTAERLREIDRSLVDGIVAKIPDDWDVEADHREWLLDFIVQRAGYVSDNIVQWLKDRCWDQQGSLFEPKSSP